MTDLDELVGRLKTPCFERGLDEGWIDKEREQAATAITTLEAEVRKQAMDYLVLSGQADEALAKVATLEAELAAMKQKRLCDHGRLLFRDDVERHCGNLDICFQYGGTVRCSPCAIKQADAEGVETLNVERVYLPEVARLNRELAAMKARGDRLAEENKALRHWSVAHIDQLLLYAAGSYPTDSHVKDAVAFCRIVAPGKQLRMDPLEASGFHPSHQALTEWRDQ